jgi:hypothetical protein
VQGLAANTLRAVFLWRAIASCCTRSTSKKMFVAANMRLLLCCGAGGASSAAGRAAAAAQESSDEAGAGRCETGAAAIRGWLEFMVEVVVNFK